MTPEHKEPVGAGVVTEEHASLIARIGSLVNTHSGFCKSDQRAAAQLLADHDAQLVAKERLARMADNELGDWQAECRKSWALFATKDAEIARLKGIATEQNDIAEEYRKDVVRLTRELHEKELLTVALGELAKDKDNDRIFFRDKAKGLEQANAALVAERDAEKKNAGDWSAANHRQIRIIQDQRAKLTAAQERERGLREALEHVAQWPVGRQAEIARAALETLASALATSKPDAGGAEGEP